VGVGVGMGMGIGVDLFVFYVLNDNLDVLAAPIV
jgi:hypothetical protein